MTFKGKSDLLYCCFQSINKKRYHNDHCIRFPFDCFIKITASTLLCQLLTGLVSMKRFRSQEVVRVLKSCSTIYAQLIGCHFVWLIAGQHLVVPIWRAFSISPQNSLIHLLMNLCPPKDFSVFCLTFVGRGHLSFFHLFEGRPLDIRCEPSIFFSFDIESLQSTE